jgi:hypothetical protein
MYQFFLAIFFFNSELQVPAPIEILKLFFISNTHLVLKIKLYRAMGGAQNVVIGFVCNASITL